MAKKKPAVQVRKPRAAGKMFKLSLARRLEIFAMSESGHTIAELCADLERKDGMTISQQSLGAWLARRRGELRLERAAELCRELTPGAESLKESGIDEAIVAQFKRVLFDMLVKDADPASIAECFRAFVQSRKLEIDERKVAVLEKKAEALDKIRNVSEGRKMTPEEKMREIDKILIG